MTFQTYIKRLAILLIVAALKPAEPLLSRQASNGSCGETVLQWSVGSVDHRFDISEDELKSVIEDAASVWSQAAGRELFRNAEERSDSSLTIHLIYSSGQHKFDTETEVADSIRVLRQSFYPKQVLYRNQVLDYQNSFERYHELLETYNLLIESYNESLSRVNVAGARTAREQEQLNRLRSQAERMRPSLLSAEQELKREERALTQLADELNSLADEINLLIYRQNELIGSWTAYRKGVYLNVAGRPKINIYQFDDLGQLRLVLTHELGHALGLSHVRNSKSIMYYRSGRQSHERPELTAEDREALKAACGSGIIYP